MTGPLLHPKNESGNRPSGWDVLYVVYIGDCEGAPDVLYLSDLYEGIGSAEVEVKVLRGNGSRETCHNNMSGQVSTALYPIPPENCTDLSRVRSIYYTVGAVRMSILAAIFAYEVILHD